MLQNVLEMYKDNRILWDNGHPDYGHKGARDEVMQVIASSLDIPNVTAADVMRKLRTMRAAYRVEIRNINTAKVRGFFYKPTLKWFNAYRNCMTEIDAMKLQNQENMESGDDEISLEEEESVPNSYLLKIKQNNLSNIKTDKSHVQIVLSSNPYDPQTQLLMDSTDKDREEDVFSDDSVDDEFQLFSDHIGEQLRSMSCSKAVLIQHQIKKIFDKDRKMNGLPQLLTISNSHPN